MPSKVIPIFICEAKQQQLEKITKFISDYILMENLDMKVAISTRNPHEILDYIKKNRVTGLYFLDVQLETNITGIQLASKIRQHDKRAALAFITSDIDSLHLIFKYSTEAMKYIEKDGASMLREIKECIQLAEERLLNDDTKRFIFRQGDKLFSEKYDDIMLFETIVGQKNRLRMIGRNREIKFYGSLAKIEKQLNHNSFYRFTGSVLINLDNIEMVRLRKREVEMKNGYICEGVAKKMEKLATLIEN